MASGKHFMATSQHCVASHHAEKTHTALQAMDAVLLQQCATLCALGLDCAKIVYQKPTTPEFAILVHSRVCTKTENAYNFPD